MADEAYYKRLWNYDDDSYDYWDEMVSADWDTPASVATLWDVGFFNLVFIYIFIHWNNIQYIA